MSRSSSWLDDSSSSRALDLGCGTELSGWSARNWRALSIWSAQRGVGQRLGANQVVDDPPLGGGPAGGQLVLERAGQGEHLGAARCVGKFAKERVERRPAAFSGSSIAASESASAWTSFQRSSWRTSSRACSTLRIAGASCGACSLSCRAGSSRSGGAVPVAT